jgi:para-nitrobenzyl esterase
MIKELQNQGAVTRRAMLQTMLIGGSVAFLGNRLNLAHAVASTSPLLAETIYGKIRGAQVNGVSMFAGIPYGATTAGAGRFMPPSKPAKWTGVRDATAPGPRAMQTEGPLGPPTGNPVGDTIDFYFTGGRANSFELANTKMGEDCLVLNVVTGSLKGKRPVMVFIHGGGFASGDGILALSADKWIREEDIVVVGVNHRLNTFGYTYLGGISEKYADSGNVGQLDLIAALEWVRDNIANFGGDPQNVTIFGQSGGGAKISTLMAMPKAKGLFNKAIVESGSMLSVATKEEATDRAKALLKALGLNEAQVDELQKIPADKLLAVKLPTIGAIPSIIAMGARPVIDGRSIPQQTWTPNAPKTASGVSMIIGNCKDESATYGLGDPSLYSLDEAGLREREIKAGIPESEVDKLLALYHRDYPSDSPTDLYFRISSDRGARRNVINQADRKLAGGAGNVYVYQFAWNTPVLDGKLRAFHTAELPLVYRRVAYPESEELSKQLGGAWAAFARKGDPNHTGMPNWAPYTASDRPTMVFNAGKTRLVNNPSKEALEILERYPSNSLL